MVWPQASADVVALCGRAETSLMATFRWTLFGTVENGGTAA